MKVETELQPRTLLIWDEVRRLLQSVFQFMSITKGPGTIGAITLPWSNDQSLNLIPGRSEVLVGPGRTDYYGNPKNRAFYFLKKK